MRNPIQEKTKKTKTQVSIYFNIVTCCGLHILCPELEQSVITVTGQPTAFPVVQSFTLNFLICHFFSRMNKGKRN
jgi:hypothetical protein